MITLKNILDWLKHYNLADNYYIGKLENKKPKSIGLYTLKGNNPPYISFGENETYDITNVSMLIHWNNNANETEITSRTVFELLRTIKNVTIDETMVYMIELLTPEPVDVGTDDNGIFERVIEFKIYYERK